MYKEGDANTVQLAQAVRERVAELGNSLPADSQLRTVYYQSTFIANSVSEVSNGAIWGGLLSVIVLYLFLRDARATLVAGIVIPVTVIGIFVLMYGFNLTLNIMSLGRIALSVGMLIDNSVVILEAIARKRDAGLSPVEAARAGTAEVAMAVTASTLTTVAVFFPMVFVSGIAGQLFRDQALTVTFAPGPRSTAAGEGPASRMAASACPPPGPEGRPSRRAGPSRCPVALPCRDPRPPSPTSLPRRACPRPPSRGR